MASVIMQLKNGEDLRKVECTLPPAAVASLVQGGKLDITGLITPLMRAAFESGFMTGYNQPECLNNPEAEAAELAIKKFGEL